MIYNNNLDDIMKQIKHHMVENDIKQIDIARNTGFTKATISNLLTCKSKNVTLDTLQALCKGAGCKIDITILSDN